MLAARSWFRPRPDAPARRVRRTPSVSRRSVISGLLLLAAITALPAAAQRPELPFANGERLAYTIRWPSGLPVGTGELGARSTESGWRFRMTLRADHPAMTIDDAFLANTDAELCSTEFEKHIRHGAKRAHEQLRFLPGLLERANLATDDRERPGRLAIERCTRDALAFVYFLRGELAAGRIPAPTEVFFGAGYRLRLEYSRTRRLAWQSESQLADELRAEIRGPASRHEILAYFGRDEARTPLLFRVEFDGTPFTMRLAE